MWRSSRARRYGAGGRCRATLPASSSAGLTAVGKNLFRKSAGSGEPTINAPGTQGFGTLAQGFLEKSNVDVVEEMVGMITAQRAYEINSRVIQGVDQMLEAAGGLLR